MDEEQHDLKELDKALRSAFPTRGSLERMLTYELGWRLNDIVGENVGLKEAVLQLLKDARAENRTAQLVEGAHRENGTNGLLHAYYLRCFSLDRPSGPALEKIVREELQFHNYADWLERQQRILREVCRIEVDGKPAGTGFLVGRSSVLTNYHVIVDGNDQPNASARITCRFDCTGHDSGKEYRLTPGGIVASSPWSPHDLSLDPRPDPAEDELDFALLELAEPAGDERGFVQLSADAPAFPLQTPLFIVQHPAGGPLQVAFDTQAIIGVNHNRTRIRYRTNTLTGSSGSPCFDADWRAIALHHSGDPGLHHKGVRFGHYNEGIPLDRIHAYLEDHNLLSLLS